MSTITELSINQASSWRWSFCQDVLRYATLGCSQIGIVRSKLDELDLHDAAELLYEMKMSVSSLSWVGGFTGGEMFSFARAVDDALEVLRAAATLQARCVVLHPGSQNGHTRRNAIRLLSMALDELAPAAEDLHVRLAIEPMLPHDGFDCTMLRDWQETMESIAAFPATWVGLALDLFHIGHDTSLMAELPALIDRVALVQVADRTRDCRSRSRRLTPGAGDCPLAAWWEQLRTVHYSGPIELELYGDALQEADYAGTIQAALAYLARLDGQLNGPCYS